MSRDTQILARCAGCGLVEIAVVTVVVHMAQPGGTYGITRCPSCGRSLWDRLNDGTGQVLIRLGARRGDGAFSPEVLERPPGPPITAKDVRRFRREVRRARDVAGAARVGL